MNVMNWRKLGLALCLAPMVLAACGGSGGDTTGGGGSGTGGGAGTGGMLDPGDAQTPPQGEAAVEAWLAKGHYKDWHCEPAEHEARSPSPHAVNRICSNDKLSGNADAAPYPEGSAAVKELWDKMGGKVMGYAVYLKLQDDSAGGAGWYYYENNPALDPMNPVADGKGDAGASKTICVSCHQAAGSDTMHSGHDFVYTQVK